MDPRSPLALTPEIEDFRRQFEQLSIEADAFVRPLRDAQFAWQPTPDRWSVAQCIDHLNATARVYLPVLDEGIADAMRRGLYSPGPLSIQLVGRLHVSALQPALAGSRKAQRALRTRRRTARARRSWRRSAPTRCSTSIACDRPTDSTSHARALRRRWANWLPMPLGSAFAMLIAHEHRHLAQAHRVTEMQGFPRRPGECLRRARPVEVVARRLQLPAAIAGPRTYAFSKLADGSTMWRAEMP